MKESSDKIKTVSIESPEKGSKNWLQRLKDESWEAELLVATISIFGAFQLLKMVDWWTNVFINLLNPSQYLIGYLIVFFGLFAISILVSMFIIHFFLRAYWIGLVGLNSVFPDYSIKDSAFSEIYTEKMAAALPKLKDSIKMVDELCSVIFSAAFTFLLIYMYMALLASLYLFLYNQLIDYVPGYVILIPLILVIVLMLFSTIVGSIANLKSNRSKANLQLWSFKLNRLVAIIFYGPFNKAVSQVSLIFASNFKRKKSMVYLLLLFVVSGMFVSFYKINNTNIPYLVNRESYFDTSKVYSSYYGSNNKENNFLLTPEIEADIISANVIKLFIPIFTNEIKLRNDLCGSFNEDSSKNRIEQREERGQYLLECYKKYNFIYLNGARMDVNFRRYSHPRTNQSGIICYLDLSNVKTGENKLNVVKKNEDEIHSEWSIPFYYSSDLH